MCESGTYIYIPFACSPLMVIQDIINLKRIAVLVVLLLCSFLEMNEMPPLPFPNHATAICLGDFRKSFISISSFNVVTTVLLTAHSYLSCILLFTPLPSINHCSKYSTVIFVLNHSMMKNLCTSCVSYV